MRTPLFVLFLLAGLFLWQDNANAQGESCATAVTASVGVNVAPFFDGNGGYLGPSCDPFSSGDATDAYWYEFTPAVTTTYSINSCGDGDTQDTRVSIYSGSCGGLSCVGGDDDNSAACDYVFGSSVEVDLTAGETYYIVWDDRWGDDDGFPWNIEELAPPPPPGVGESCGTAVEAVVGINTYPGYDGNEAYVGPSCDPFSTGSATDAYWYSYTAAATGTHTISSCLDVGFANPDTRVNVYGGACGALACIAGDDDSDAGTGACGFSSDVSFELTAGETVYFVWDDRWGAGDDGADWELTAPVPPPPPAAIPTMGEWGLIILFLLMLSMGTVFVMRRQTAVAGTGVSVSDNKIPFHKSVYPKVLVACFLAVAAIFAVAMAAFGYELTSADIPGALLATPVLAYLVHLVIGRKK